MDADLVTRLEQRVAALVTELQRQRERSARLEAENAALRTRNDQARRRLDALLEVVAPEES
ncbi:MAG: DNA replication initiation control protein YabA [Rhodocyclaceae bacterium]|nr:DNA replication initiation control protein YabA [Rhodocyclaceae bacterium]